MQLAEVPRLPLAPQLASSTSLTCGLQALHSPASSWEALLHSHFTGKETEAQRGQLSCGVERRGRWAARARGSPSQQCEPEHGRLRPSLGFPHFLGNEGATPDSDGCCEDGRQVRDDHHS